MLQRFTLFILLCCLCFFASAQVIDTVCLGERGVKYYVREAPATRYWWHIQGGSIINGNGSSEIEVNWGLQDGLHKIGVVPESILGYVGDSINYYVYIRKNNPELLYPNRICKWDTAILKVNGSQEILWDNQSNESTRLMKIIGDTSGWVIAKDSLCAQVEDTLYYSIQLGVQPKGDFTPDSGMFVRNEALTIKYLGRPEDKLNWEIKKLNIFGKNEHSFLIQLHDTGKTEIRLIAMSKDGCLDTSLRHVWVNEEYLIPPNAFTPNADGLNDVFTPVHFEIAQYELKIFSRWGQMLFISHNPSEGWDGNVNGQPAPPDTYTYIMYGRGRSGKEYWHKGSVDLLR